MNPDQVYRKSIPTLYQPYTNSMVTKRCTSLILVVSILSCDYFKLTG